MKEWGGREQERERERRGGRGSSSRRVVGEEAMLVSYHGVFVVRSSRSAHHGEGQCGEDEGPKTILEWQRQSATASHGVCFFGGCFPKFGALWTNAGRGDRPAQFTIIGGQVYLEGRIEKIPPLPLQQHILPSTLMLSTSLSLFSPPFSSSHPSSPLQG
jgi:hypothetical protein